jgi:hypothetical protein
VEMTTITLGDVPIAVQNDKERNEDIYKIASSSLRGIEADKKRIEAIVNEFMEDPERFVINQEEDGPNVYTKQHEAAIELAMYINKAQGVDVSDQELQAVHDRLIELQEGEVPN